MTVGYYSTNNNMLAQLLQQGFGMFGCTSMGSFGSTGMTGMMGMSGSLFGNNMFTNCYGDVDYDAMAGYGVASAVLGVVGQAVSANQANKEPKIDYSAELENVDNQIKEKTDKKNELETENSDLQTEVDNAKTQLGSLKTQISNKEIDVNNLKNAYESIKIDSTADEATQNTQKENQRKAKEAWNTAKHELDELTKQKEEQEKIINEKEPKIESNKTEIKKLEKEIGELQEKREELQEDADAEALDKANGTKLSRTSDKKYRAKINDDGSLKDDVEYDKGDLKTAVNQFMKATDPDDKKKCANTLVKMYTWVKNNNSSEITSTLQNAAKVAQRYLEENKAEA